MSTPVHRPVASLWIGEKLHYLNQLCLLSHVRAGHPTTLYCTDKVSNVPEGVIVKPATDIMAIDMDIVSQTSESFLSNVFRYKMIKAIDAVWIDCDAYCHKPFPDEMQNIYAGHGFRGALNCGVVYIPPKGELMAQLLDYYENLPAAPAWFNKQQRKRIEKQEAHLPQAVRIYNEVARNTVLDHLRRRRPTLPLPPDLAAAEPAETCDAPVDQLAQCLPRVLAELSPEDREAVSLCDLGGMSQAAFAELKGLSLPGAKSRVQRARRRLREQLSVACQVKLDGAGKGCCFVPRPPID